MQNETLTDNLPINPRRTSRSNRFLVRVPYYTGAFFLGLFLCLFFLPGCGKAELEKTQAQLKETQAQLKETHTQLKGTQAQLKATRTELDKIYTNQYGIILSPHLQGKHIVLYLLEKEGLIFKAHKTHQGIVNQISPDEITITTTTITAEFRGPGQKITIPFDKIIGYRLEKRVTVEEKEDY